AFASSARRRRRLRYVACVRVERLQRSGDRRYERSTWVKCLACSLRWHLVSPYLPPTSLHPYHSCPFLHKSCAFVQRGKHLLDLPLVSWKVPLVQLADPHCVLGWHRGLLEIAQLEVKSVLVPRDLDVCDTPLTGLSTAPTGI